jgi:hypothetical protein
MLRLVLSLVVVVLATPAGQTSVRHLDVTVGGVVEADVDYKIGFACDDNSILNARMETRGDRNWFIVEGVAPGRTYCRVGGPELPSYLFDVEVRQ